MIEHRGTWTNSPSAYNLQWEDCDSNGNHCVPIFGAASRTYTLQAADIGHTVRVLETATNPDGPSVPVTSNVTSVVTAPNVTVRDVRVRGARVAVRMRCEANVDASCTVSLTLTAVETVKNGKVIAVAASKRRGTHPLITQRTVLLGRATVRLAAGQSKTVLIFLNALGRRLLSQRHRLSAQLVVKQAQHVLFQRRFTIKPSRH